MSRLPTRRRQPLRWAKGKLTSIDEVRTLRSEVAEVRTLAIRAYEQTQARASHLLHLRRTPMWEEAYAERPLVSVRIGAYHGGDLLFDRALCSVQNQTYDEWEAVIVCDGPDEETVTRVQELDDPRIRCFERPRNGPYPTGGGAKWRVAGAHPFNEGIAVARGAWIAPIDQDDDWTPDHIEVLLDAARRTRAEMVYGVNRVIVEAYGQTYFGDWPPTHGDVGLQAAIYHAGLTDFLYDVNSYLLGEPADWNLVRRMVEAGVRVDYVPRIVGSYYVERHRQTYEWWCEQVRVRGAFTDAVASTAGSS